MIQFYILIYVWKYFHKMLRKIHVTLLTNGFQLSGTWNTESNVVLLSSHCSLRTSYVLSHLFSWPPMKYHQIHFVDGTAEGQRSWGVYPEAQSWFMSGSGFEPRPEQLQNPEPWLMHDTWDPDVNAWHAACMGWKALAVWGKVGGVSTCEPFPFLQWASHDGSSIVHWLLIDTHRATW